MDKNKKLPQKKLIFLLLFLVALFFSSCGVSTKNQDYGNLYGRVVSNTTFLSIEGAKINFTGASSTVSTTSEGTFQIKDVATGTLTFVVEAEKCSQAETNIKCESKSGTTNYQPYIKNLVLQKGDNFLDTIILQDAISFTTPGTVSGTFSSPRGIARDSSDNFYIADTKNHQVQKFSSTGAWLGEFGSEGTDNGKFENPYDVTVDSSGNIFVADTFNHRIQKCTSFEAASCTTFYGTTGTFGSSDVLLNLPSGVFVTPQGILFIIDTFNHRILAVSADSGSLLFKIGGTKGNGNYEFNYPTDVATDISGNIYVADNWNHRVQKFSATGTYLETFGSRGNTTGFFTNPYSLAFDSSGRLYISDYDNKKIQVYTFYTNYFSDDILTVTNKPLGITVLSSGDIIFSDSSGQILKSKRQ